jgi:hypothetical protein
MSRVKGGPIRLGHIFLAEKNDVVVSNYSKLIYRTPPTQAAVCVGQRTVGILLMVTKQQDYPCMDIACIVALEF